MIQDRRWLLFAVLLSICLLHCDYRKYDDGPYFSIFPTENRLINTWEWQLAITNDVPLTGFYADSTISFLDDATVRICDREGQCREGSWSLVSKRNRLQMIFGTETELYSIRMLKRNEIWLRSSDTLATTVMEWELTPLTE